MKARDIMMTHPSVVTPDDTMAAAARIMRDRNLGVLPVIDDLLSRCLAGILTDHDIVVRCVAEGHEAGCRVRDHMTTARLVWVDADADVSEVAAKMEEAGLRRIPVLDEGHRVVGVVVLADLHVRVRLSNPVLVEELEQHLYPPGSATT